MDSIDPVSCNYREVLSTEVKVFRVFGTVFSPHCLKELCNVIFSMIGIGKNLDNAQLAVDFVSPFDGHLCVAQIADYSNKVRFRHYEDEDEDE